MGYFRMFPVGWICDHSFDNWVDYVEIVFGNFNTALLSQGEANKKATLGGGDSNIFGNFHPDPWGRWTHFDGRIFFKWVGEKPPTRKVEWNDGFDIIFTMYHRNLWVPLPQYLRVGGGGVTVN